MPPQRLFKLKSTKQYTHTMNEDISHFSVNAAVT